MFLRFIISLIVAVISAKIFHFIFFLKSYFLSFLVGILVYYIVYKLLKIIMIKNKSGTVNGAVKAVMAEKAVKEGVEKLKNIRNNTRMIANNEIAAKIQDICKTGFDIFDYIDKNPDDLSKAKQFINYYLDTTEKIVDQYVELSAKKEKTQEIEDSLKSVEAILDSIKETYTKQLQNLLEDDLLDLNTEIKVLEKTMKFES